MRTPSGRKSDLRQLRNASAGRWVKWKRAFLLAPLLASLLFVSLVERADVAFGKTGRAMVVAALKDPLSLFADRSPGERGTGPLQMTKSGPHERVLSTVRDREPPADDLADAADIPATDPAAILDTFPTDGVLPADRVFGAIPWPVSFPYPGLDWPDTFPGPGTPPPTVPPTEPPVVSPVPEPATWLLMLAGLLIVGFGMRQNGGKQPGECSGAVCSVCVAI